MKLAKTDYDYLYEDIYSLVLNTVAITEAPDQYGIPTTTKVKAIKELTDATFMRIMRKIRCQRDRVCTVSSN
jgi:hypothetical protein